MSTKGERYADALAAKEKEFKNEVTEQPKPASYGNEFQIVEETEPAASVAPPRTLDQSEAEYQALLHGENAPAWARPADNSTNRPAGDVVLDGSVEPALVETPEKFAAAVAELNAAHTKAVEELGNAHKRRLGQMVATRRAQEVQDEQAASKGVAGRLKDVLRSMAEEQEATGTTPAQAAAQTSADLEAAVEAKLRERIAPSLAAADAVAAQLHLWSSQFLSPFRQLKENDRSTWLDSMPSTTSEEIQSSAAMAHGIERLLNECLSLYDMALGTQRDRRSRIESLITRGRFRLDHYEFERELVQLLHDLKTADVADSLHNYARGITDLLLRIREKKASVRGVPQPTILFEDKQAMLDRTAQAAEMTKQGNEHGRPTVADTGGEGWKGIR